MSGYEIKKVVDIRFGFFWNESFGADFFLRSDGYSKKG
jgi:hypothetical protein